MGASVASGSASFATAAQLRSLLTLLNKHKVRELDTARVYGNGRSETLLGEVSDALDTHTFDLATKAPGFTPGSLTHGNIIRACNDSLAALKQSSIDLYYLHGPDRQTSLEESCRAINQLHQERKFARFGISNFHVDEVIEIVGLCRKNNWVQPSVYQGGYNPISRGMEAELLPKLRECGIAFYAYSPLGGGFFSRPAEQLRTPPAGGRMDQMRVFQMIYVNDVSMHLLEKLTQECEKEDLTVKEATLRWLMHHSPLQEEDGIILGASSEEQMSQNLAACGGGPLPQSVVDTFEDMWKQYRAAGKGAQYSV
ncbi:Aldo/keto reductase [Teratosphaeria nubilosa]|uniref:Aldo/keto reductase n=1 Tax=Teratosphaeria nubilosa TaxID=161662 RepID=A0A6G1KVS2_9PEZI|nr:Aldo/keto reductase [Teratosphaeria nubilosa]